MSLLGRRSRGYSKLDYEDPEEVKHRRAQFLIYRALERADDSLRRQSRLRMKMCKLKIKIGKRLRKLRKTILLTISAAKGGAYKQIIAQLKLWKFLVRGSKDSVLSLPPIAVT